MRNFIDTLAARAVGGESMLSPRLPSVFEPQRPLPMGFPEEAREIEAPAPPQVTTMQGRVGTPSEARVPPARAAVPAVIMAVTSTSPARPAAKRHEAHAEPAPMTALVGRKLTTEPDHSPPSRAPLVPTALERAAATSPVQRERMVDVLSATEGRNATDEGTLLTPAQSVFRTPPAPVAATARGFPGGHHAQALAASAAPEPVVHVSIGRLEVRATPSPGKPAVQRQDAAQSSPLDDYLRQRGKASP